MAGTLMQRAMLHLKGRLDASVGIVVQLRAGSEIIEELDAVPVTAQFADFATMDHIVSAQQFDWIVKADDLVFSGVRLEPRDGWELGYHLPDGRWAIYKVLPGETGRCFEREDPIGMLYNIHTKLDRIESA